MGRSRLAQISDPHVPADGDAPRAGTDPAGHLRLAVEHASRRCDAILLSGDLAAHAGTDAEYDRLAEVLQSASVPVWLLPGNHDDPARLRERFALTVVGERLDHVVGELGGVRIVALDSSRAGRVDGELDADQCEWLGGVLSDGVPCLVALHHPCVPLRDEAPAMLRLDDESIERLATAVRGRSVLAIVTGHAHATVFTSLADVPVVICPSSSHEFGFFEGDGTYLPGPPHYLEHSWDEGGANLLTRVITVDDASRRPMR